MRRPQDSGQKTDFASLICYFGQVVFSHQKVGTVILDSLYHPGFCDY